MYLENRTFRIMLIASSAHCGADQIDWVFDFALVEDILRERTGLHPHPPTPDECIARNRLAVHVGTLSKEEKWKIKKLNIEMRIDCTRGSA